MMTTTESVATEATQKGSALEVLRVFFKLGLSCFGRPIAHIGYFREEFVARRKWIDEHAYADLVGLCQFLPAGQQPGRIFHWADACGLSRRACRLDRIHTAVGHCARAVCLRSGRAQRPCGNGIAAWPEACRRRYRGSSCLGHGPLALSGSGTCIHCRHRGRATARRSRMFRDNTSCISMSAVSMPIPITRANRRTMTCGPSQGACSIRSRRSSSICRI